ncbi:putative NRPS-like enzyme [Stipitochalara longipes BDJ]|nr:putative NRPS-like enzyme [Stipitochalara longipes BDJ]
MTKHSDAEAPNSHQLLPTIFETRAKLNPDGVFAQFPVSPTNYDSGFRSVTNLQALNAINHVAWAIEKSFGKGQNFETIAYLGPSDPRSHLVLIAGIKVGYKIFLPSPRNSKAAFSSLFNRLECCKLVCTNPELPAVSVIFQEREMQKLHIPSLHELLSYENVEHYPFDKSFEEERDNPIFVLHTSGSTGIPKPLIYKNEFVTRIVNLCSIPDPGGFRVLDRNYLSGRFYISLPIFHIAGIGFSLVIPTFFGNIPVFPLPAGPPTIESFIGAVKNGDLDWAFLPPVVIDDLSKDPTLLELVSSKLKYLYYVGGSLPQASGDIVYAKIPLYQSLGSSECSIFPLIRRNEDLSFVDWNYIQIHPSLQAEFQHRFEDLHELVIIKRSESEHLQPVFVHFPEEEKFETKDLFAPHSTKPGLWKHQSRIDDVIVFINGEKTNPVSFENEVASHPEVRSALVVGQGRFEASLLVELVKSTYLNLNQRGEFIERIWNIVQSANRKCPAWARVSKSKILLTDPEIPMERAGKGTVMRQATLIAYQKKLDDLYLAANSANSIAAIDVNDHEVVVHTVYELVIYVTDWNNLEKCNDFFSLGMDSLQVLRLVQELRFRFPTQSLAPSIVYGNPSVDLLANALSSGSTEEKDAATNLIDVPRTTLSETRDMYEKGIDLLAKSLPQRSETTIVESSRPRVILLTGSTGALGSYILQNLLLDKTVVHIYCLNRSPDSKSLQIARNADRHLQADLSSSRTTFLACDLSMPNFGVDKSIYEKMLSTATHIIHNAWPVDFNRTLQSFQPSLDGVSGLISFSAQATLSPVILFLSSISSAINYRNAPGTESIIPETVSYDDSSPAPMGYGESKYIAERMFDHAARKLNITTGAVRIGQIAGTSHNPRGWNRNEWLPSLVLSSRYIGALPDTLGARDSNSSGVMSNINWIPIDQLSEILVELTFHLSEGTSSPEEQVFHAVNPNPVTWESLLPTVQKTLEETLSIEGETAVSRIEIVSLPTWIERLRKTASAVTDARTLGESADILYRNPGLKLLDFYQSLAASDTSAPRSIFDIRKTSEASPSLKNLEAIRKEWMAGWINDWVLPS